MRLKLGFSFMTIFLGIEADLKYPGATTKYNSIAEFFKAKLLQ